MQPNVDGNNRSRKGAARLKRGFQRVAGTLTIK